VHRRFRCPTTALAALVLVAFAAAPARAERGHTIRDNRHLWATINVCDTLAHPDAIGIRGSMPGTGRAKEQMYMRFQAQYFRASDGLWHNIPKGGDSGFVHVGSSMFKARQAGRLFIFAPPAGGSWQMRGVVTFEWRLGKRTVLHVRMRTTAGHHAAQADPAGYSSDTCVIS
jgi:hypothetical protein